MTAQEQLQQYHAEEASRRESSAVPVVSAAGGEITVEDVFRITGRGLVATGIVAGGTIRVGDRVKLLRAQEEFGSSEVTGVETFGKRRSEAASGANVGLLLRGSHEIARGDVIRVTPAS